jgi:hypothetical protein
MDVGIVGAGGSCKNGAFYTLIPDSIVESISGAKCAAVCRATGSREMDYAHGTALPEVSLDGERKDRHHSWNINNDQTKSVESLRPAQ